MKSPARTGLAAIVCCAAIFHPALAQTPAPFTAVASPVPSAVRLELAPPAAIAQGVLQILIDTDRDPATGFAMDAGGFDLLIEGRNIHRFTGDDPAAWSWRSVGQAKLTADADRQTLEIDAALLGADAATTIGVLARLLTSDYAVETARFPLEGVMLVKPVVAVEGDEASGDADDPARDITAVRLVQDGSQLVVTVSTRQASDFANLLIFLDIDGDAQTGFQSAHAPQFGFDALIQGGTFSRFTGQTRDAWVWQAKGEAAVSVNADTLTVRFDAALIGGDTLGLAAWMMSADWQTLVDRAPDAGLYHLKLDAGKIIAAPRSEPVAAAAPKANRDLPPRQRVAQARSFYTYYGSGQVAALSHHDVVIAHSPQMSKADIAALKELGVVVIGYISVGEDDQMRRGDGTGPGGFASWYFDMDANDQPDENGIWKSYYANTLDPAWRADRLAEARRLVEEDGYDGIFLDTIDTVTRYRHTEQGMVQMVSEFRQALPDAPIILNQGYTLLERLAPLADGLMLESFTATYDFESRQYLLNTPASLDWHRRNVERMIQPVLAKYPLKVLVLDYALESQREAIQTAADRAVTFGFLFAISPIFLDQVYHLDIVGRPDPRWLQRLATPQTLSITLGEPANGFPAGTRLLPSGCFAGYRVDPLVDGITDRAALPWTRSAWASAEDEEEAWVAAEFPAAQSGGRLTVTWARDGGRVYASRQFCIQVRRAGQWLTVRQFDDNQDEQVAVALPGEPFDALRVVQPVGGGHALRPNLMWMAQLARF